MTGHDPMQRSLEQYQISPQAYFDGVDQSFSDLRAIASGLGARLDAVAALCEELARTRPPPQAASPPPTRWTYDVRLPNHLFDDVSPPEQGPSGVRRRVGGSARIGATLLLPRNVQYDFAVEAEEFASEVAARSFYVRIDGASYPWLSVAAGRYATIVLAAERGDRLTFELGVDAALLPSERATAFAFRTIDIVRRA